MPHDASGPITDTIRAAVAVRGVAPVARALGVPRAAIASYLAGSARAGTRLVIETRAAERGVPGPADE